MYKTNDKDIWRVFREHHYLTRNLNKSATCYTLYWNDILIGFGAVLAYPSGTVKYSRRYSRIVILPDYQGLGAGAKFMEFLANFYLSKGYKFFTRFSHSKMRRHCEYSNLWLATSANNKQSNVEYNGGYNNLLPDTSRVCGSFEYMGRDYVNKPHITIHIDDNQNINYEILRSDLKFLKEKYYICVVTGEINTPSKIEDMCLELGIRTQLLYNTKKGVAKIGAKYKNKKIITIYDEEFSKKVRKIYTQKYDELYQRHLQGLDYE